MARPRTCRRVSSRALRVGLRPDIPPANPLSRGRRAQARRLPPGLEAAVRPRRWTGPVDHRRARPPRLSYHQPSGVDHSTDPGAWAVPHLCVSRRTRE